MWITIERQSFYSLYQTRISPRRKLMQSLRDPLDIQILHLTRIIDFVGLSHRFYHLVNIFEGHHFRQYYGYRLENGFVFQISVRSANKTHTSKIWADARQPQNITRTLQPHQLCTTFDKKKECLHQNSESAWNRLRQNPVVLHVVWEQELSHAGSLTCRID